MAGEGWVVVNCPRAASRAFSSACSLRDGGKTGNGASSKRGGSFLVAFVSIDDALDLLPPYEKPDCVE